MAGASECGPVSPAQEQIWIEDQLDPAVGLYNEALVLRIHGALDLVRLQTAIDATVATQPALRTVVQRVGQDLVQRVLRYHRSVLRPLPGGRSRPCSRDGAAAAVTERAAGVIEEPYAIDRVPPHRWATSDAVPGEHLLLFAHHHIILDASSAVRVLDEVLLRYARLFDPTNAETSSRYLDFAAWHRGTVRSGELDTSTARLADLITAIPPMVVPPHCPGPNDVSAAGLCVDHYPAGLAAGVRACAVRHRVTPFHVLLAAFAIQLHRYARQNEFWLGLGMSGRPPELAEVIGEFASMVPIGLKLTPDMAFSDVLVQVRESCLEGVADQLTPMTAVHRRARLPRNPARPSLARVVFNGIPPLRPSAIPGVEVTVVHLPRRRARFDLLLTAELMADGITSVLEFDSSLYSNAAARRILRDHAETLQVLTADPSGRPRDLTYLAAWPRPTEGQADAMCDDTAGVLADTSTDDPLTQGVVAICSDVLEVSLEPDDDFFAAGGSSVAAAVFADRLAQELGVDITLRGVFEHPVLTDLSAALLRRYPDLPAALRASRELDEAALETLLGPDTTPTNTEQVDGTPLKPVELPLWKLDQLSPGHHVNTSTLAFRGQGSLDADALSWSLHRLSVDIGMLRSYVKAQAGQSPVRRVAATAEFPYEQHDLRSLSVAHWEATVADLRHTLAVTDMPLDRPPLVRAILTRGPCNRWELLLKFHHVVIDYHSIVDVVLPHLERCYAARVADRDVPSVSIAPAPAPLDAQEKQRATRYWAAQLAGVTPLELPLDRQVPASALSGTHTSRMLPQPKLADLRSTAASHGLTLFTLVSTATMAALHRWSHSQDVQIMTPFNLRTARSRSAVGFYVNLVLLRLECHVGSTWETLLAAVRNQVLDAFDHGRLPVQEALGAADGVDTLIALSSGRYTTVNVLQEAMQLTLAGAGSATGCIVPHHASGCDLELLATPVDDGLLIDLVYRAGAWSEQTREWFESTLFAALDELAVGDLSKTPFSNTGVPPRPSPPRLPS